MFEKVNKSKVSNHFFKLFTTPNRRTKRGEFDSKVEINDWFSSILHELERKYKMSYEDQKLGYSFRQVLETLVVLFAGASALSFLRPVRCGCTGWGRGPHSASRSLGGVNGAEAALSYEEKQELAI